VAAGVKGVTATTASSGDLTVDVDPGESLDTAATQQPDSSSSISRSSVAAIFASLR